MGENLKTGNHEPLYVASTTKKESIFGLKTSKELKKLIAKEPSLLEEENHPICRASEYNFISALLIRLYEAKFKKLFETNLLQHPISILNPITIENNKKFVLPNDETQEIFVAEKILLKPAIGFDSAVIISGPYTGLILDCTPFVLDETIAQADRIWHTKSVYSTDSQYPVLLYDIKKLLPKPEFDKLSEETFLILKTLFKKWVTSNPQLTTTTDHILHLCKELGIPLEIDSNNKIGS